MAASEYKKEKSNGGETLFPRFCDIISLRFNDLLKHDNQRQLRRLIVTCVANLRL